ncbi:MAG: asparaginase [Alphaproteobacteria bacterium]|nr:asparaginase [Alphaproteobacteria bacterium]
MQKIIILGTGGTIAGWVSDPSQPHRYQSGQVGVDRLLAEVPVPAGVQVEYEQMAQIDSKDATDDFWRRLLSRAAHHLARADVHGLVITHGTDTLEESAFLLSALLMAAKPVVLTGAMRAANHTQADGPGNLHDALLVASSSALQGVVVVFAGRVWPGCEVQKISTSSVDAFRALPSGPLGVVDSGGYRGETLAKPAPSSEPWPALDRVLGLDPWPRVEWLSSHGGAQPWLLRTLCRGDEGPALRGLVVAGTGSGTWHGSWDEGLQALQASGVRIWVSTRCLPDRLADGQGALFRTVPYSPCQARVGLMLSLIS